MSVRHGISKESDALTPSHPMPVIQPSQPDLNDRQKKIDQRIADVKEFGELPGSHRSVEHDDRELELFKFLDYTLCEEIYSDVSVADYEGDRRSCDIVVIDISSLSPATQH